MFNKKEGVEGQFPEFVGNSHYEKFWNHLDRRELRDFGSTKPFTKNFKRVTGQIREFEFIFVIKDHQPIDWLLPSFFLHTFR